MESRALVQRNDRMHFSISAPVPGEATRGQKGRAPRRTDRANQRRGGASWIPRWMLPPRIGHRPPPDLRELDRGQREGRADTRAAVRPASCPGAAKPAGLQWDEGKAAEPVNGVARCAGSTAGKSRARAAPHDTRPRAERPASCRSAALKPPSNHLQAVDASVRRPSHVSNMHVKVRRPP